MSQTLKALGLMSGTSMDGIDAAVIETDGERITALGAVQYRPYGEEERAAVRTAVSVAADWAPGSPRPPELDTAETVLTRAHGDVVEALLSEAGLTPDEIDVVGFHGQTVLHQPHRRRTVQLGSGDALAKRLGMPVVYDFRSADVAAGGEGAPLAPLYHAARAQEISGDAPIVVLNAGGVGNVTWIGPDGAVLAFDTGPANAPLDDWVLQHTGRTRDEGGELAAAGAVDEARIAEALTHGFFERPPPKSLDRLDFTSALAEGLSLESGAATLIHFSAACVAAAGRHFPEPVSRVIVCGGGRHNPVFMDALSLRLGVPVDPAESVGWRGDMIEAEAFAFLAVRHLHGLPLSLPTTTGVPRPMLGGRLARP